MHLIWPRGQVSPRKSLHTVHTLHTLITCITHFAITWQGQGQEHGKAWQAQGKSMAKFIRSRFARAVLLQGAMARPRNIDERQGQVPPSGIAPAAARGSIAHVVRTGGVDDPLLGMYGRISNMGTIHVRWTVALFLLLLPDHW